MNTQERLLASAADLFAEKGFGYASIAEILKRADANSGSLYYFYPKKEDLLVAVLENYRDNIDEMLIEPAWQGVDDPIERIFALLARYRKLLLESECRYGCPIGSLALEIHQPTPAVAQRLGENFDEWKQRVVICLEQAGDRLPKDIDRGGLADLILSVMEGAVMQSKAYGTLGAFDASVAVLRDYFDRLIESRRD